ncbi:MAG: DUF3574 domain-containing protein [Chloroflexi bacterium]|nr:DUF3574 domain-containing protein [Chloroflexota bacterium]
MIQQLWTLLVVVGLGIAVLVAACSDNSPMSCPDGMEAYTSFNYYFGQEKSDGSVVNDAEWSEFLANVVTPRFPDGLTVFDAQGQWLDTDADRLYREGTKVLNILVPSEATADAKRTLDEIADVYVERFEQQAVFKTSVSACAGF